MIGWVKDFLTYFLAPALGRFAPYLERAWLTIGNALGIQGTTDDVVTHTGQVLHTAATDQNDAVLLQIVADAGNVRGDLDTIRELDTGNLTQSRVRLLGGHGTNGSADAALLGAVLIAVGLLLGVVALQKSGGSGFSSPGPHGLCVRAG